MTLGRSGGLPGFDNVAELVQALGERLSLPYLDHHPTVG
jgi:hypothetical protein